MSMVIAEISAERQQRVVQLTRAGYCASAIAAQLGINKRSVQRYRQRAGVSRTELRRERTPDEILARAAMLLEDGASYVEAARTVGVERKVLARHLPGYTWTPAQCTAQGHLMRQMNQINRSGWSVFR